MMTFSLSPRSGSFLPAVAASASTRVVRWNEAADRKLSVASDASVIPSSHPVGRGGRPAQLGDALVLVLELKPIDNLALEEVRVSMVADLALAEHLPDDDLDVLVVDDNALSAVDLLDLADQVLLHATDTLELKHSLRIERPGRQTVAGTDVLVSRGRRGRHGGAPGGTSRS